MNISFLHIPKTGGKSFRNSLKTKKIKYCSCSRGHDPVSFLMNCENEPNHFYATFIRDPYDLILSGYNFIHETIEFYQDLKERVNMRDSEDIFDQIAIEVIESGVSKDEFISSFPANSLYTKFFDKKDISSFDFVGVMYQYSRSIKLFNKITKTPIPERRMNVLNKAGAGQNHESNFSREDFKNKHYLDYEIYERGIERFNELCKKHSV